MPTAASIAALLKEKMWVSSHSEQLMSTLHLGYNAGRRADYTNIILDMYTVFIYLCRQQQGDGLAQWSTAVLRAVGVQVPAGAGNFFLHHHIQTGSGPSKFPSQWVRGPLSLGVKRPRQEADHSPPSSAKVKEWVES
jgi:hypothetical protein